MRIALFLLALILTAACESQSNPQQSAAASETIESESPTIPCIREWRELEPGLRYRSSGCSESSDGPELHLVELDPAQWEIEAIETKPMTTAEAARRAGAKFGINANFFDEQQRPLGLIVNDGKALNPLHPVSWQSVFYIDAEGVSGIQPQEKWPPGGRVATAVQCGPRLVINGEKNDVERAEPSLRSGVCITRDDKLVFFASGASGFFDVHEMVAKAADRELLGCRDAMLFDGGPSAQMFLDSSIDITAEGDLVPAHLIARPKNVTASASSSSP